MAESERVSSDFVQFLIKFDLIDVFIVSTSTH
jgi:hypothetical protein